jgi:hypothetical protein
MIAWGSGCVPGHLLLTNKALKGEDTNEVVLGVRQRSLNFKHLPSPRRCVGGAVENQAFAAPSDTWFWLGSD